MLICSFSLSAQYYHPLDIKNQYPGDDIAETIYENALQTQLDESATAVRTTWIANRPKDNWFMSAGAGFAILMAEESRYLDMSDLMSPTFQFALGKWFSPVWGLRLNATGSKLTGYASLNNGLGIGSWYTGRNYTNGLGLPGSNNAYTDITIPSGTEYIKKYYLNMDDPVHTDRGGDGYTYDITYAAASIDFLLNLKNLFTTYNPKALFNPVLYGGLGYAHTFAKENKEEKDKGRTAVNSIMGKVGMQFNFRLCDSWDFFVDGQLLVLPEVFDRRVGDDMTQDGVANLTAGFTYRFNFRHFIKAPLYDQREVEALNREINALRNRPEVICPPAVICPPVREEAEIIALTPVFFTLDSYVVRENQWLSIAKAAEYLLDNPKAKLRIAAYADKNTGNPTHNLKLSENRAKAVARVLVESFGINRNRIETEYYGDKVQPFEENDWNRVAIFVLP